MNALIQVLCVFSLILAPFTIAADDDTERQRPVRAPGYMPNNHPLTHGLLWVDVGFGIVNTYFDGDAQRQDLGSGEIPTLGNIETNAEIATTILHVGGSYTVGRIGDWGINLGADLGLAGQTLTADAVPGLLESTHQTTGLSAQNFALVGEAAASGHTVRAGYLLDLASDAGPEDLKITDREHAVLVGAEAEASLLQRLHVFGGLDYFVTLSAPQTEIRPSASGMQSITVEDRGDLLNARIGAGLAVRSVEFGLMGLYRMKRQSSFDAEHVGQLAEFGSPNEFDQGYVISLAPYITMAPTRLPVQFYLKGALQREYQDYGFAISGSNDIAPRLGGSFGLIYDI